MKSVAVRCGAFGMLVAALCGCASQSTSGSVAASSNSSTGSSSASVGLVGILTRNDEPGICMDGAVHLLHSGQGVCYRVKPQRGPTAQLDKAVQNHSLVRLTGNMVQGTECAYFSVVGVFVLIDPTNDCQRSNNIAPARDGHFPWSSAEEIR